MIVTRAKMKGVILAGTCASLLVMAGCGARASVPAAPAGQAAGGTAAAPGAGSGTNARKGLPGAGGRAFAAIRVQTVTVHVGTLTATNDTAGSVMPATQSSVASQVAGVALRVVHQAGDWVQAGATVVQLDDSQLKLAVQNAQSALESARINFAVGQDNSSQANPKLVLQWQSAQSALSSAQKNYDAQKALNDIGGNSASQLDNARSQLEQAQANLEAAKTALDQNQKADTQSIAQLKLAVDQAQNQLQIARLNLQNAAIKAPFAGQIAAVNVNPGTYVGLNTGVFVLVSADRQINFNVPPPDAPNFKVGSTVQFSYLGASYPVRISQAPSAPISGVVPMVAAVPRNISLPYGAVGTVSYTLTIAKGVLVPIAALEVNEDKNYLYAVDNGKVATQNITILGEAGTTAAVEGIGEGTQVIVNAPPGLLAGAGVQTISLAAEQEKKQ